MPRQRIATIHENPRAWRFIRRALLLRCPECGISPLFKPLRQTRSLFDYFEPLDGCPRCGFGYEREQGYFLLAIWGVNYGIVAGLALLISLLLEWLHPLTLWQYIWFVFAPMPLLSMLLARHAKALFLAMDHYFDPHLKPGASRQASEHPLDDDGHEHPFQP
jgi:uncharacterized protein (DUF983 family)